jgi:hypothetical protein
MPQIYFGEKRVQTMNYSRILAIVAVVGGAAFASAGSDIARWNFTAVIAAPDNTPTATTDLTSAFLTQLGMTNGYTNSAGVVGSQASCDVLQTGGDPNSPPSTGYTWRVRGNGNLASGAAGGNGWSLSAPQYTQGLEMDVSTVGFSSIDIGFDVFSTNQGVADLQVQYNTNINNSAGWTNFKGSFAGTTALNGNQAVTHDAAGDTILVMTPNTYNLSSSNNAVTNFINFDANGIAGANNDANFGIRLVSCFDPVAGTYLGASGGTYNNNSGNWRFDQLVVQGSPAPELPTGVVFAVVGLGVIFLKTRRA